MLKNRFLTAAATAALCAALLGPAGCKKKEEAKKAEAAAGAPGDKAGDKPGEMAKAAAPVIAVLPDVDLVAGDKIVGWMSIQSLDGLFNVIDTIGGKVGATPPGGSSKTMAYEQLTTLLASQGITGHEWLDKTKAIHVAFQDDVAPADPAKPGDTAMTVAGGAFVVLHVTDKAKAAGAMAAAKKGPEAEGHELMLMITDKKLYMDFVGNALVMTSDKDRFAKCKGFVERLDKIEVPGLFYLGLSIEDLAKTRAKEVDAFLAALETGAMPGSAGLAAANPLMANQTAALAMYGKMARQWVSDLQRVEMILGADVNNTKFEVRMTAKDGSKLAKQLAAGKGRTPKDIANLLPSNSYLTFAASMDPAPSMENIDQMMPMLKDLLKLDAVAFDAFVADLKAGAKLQDGTSALAFYPDGAAAVGMLVIAGSTDGDSELKLTKKAISGLLTQVLAMQEIEAKKDPAHKEDPQMAIVKKAVAEAKIDPVLQAYGPVMKEAGVTLTSNTTKDGDMTCDVLDIAMDWVKLGQSGGEQAVMAKGILGDKTAMALCTSKTKLTMAVGPGALENAKRAAQGKATGLDAAPIYKASVEKLQGASWLMYVNPGAALAAFKAVPGLPTIQADRAVVMAGQNRTKSYGFELDVPVDLIVAAKNAMNPAPAAPPAMPGEPPAGVAPKGPTGAMPTK